MYDNDGEQDRLTIAAFFVATAVAFYLAVLPIHFVAGHPNLAEFLADILILVTPVPAGFALVYILARAYELQFRTKTTKTDLVGLGLVKGIKRFSYDKAVSYYLPMVVCLLVMYFVSH